MSNEKLYEKYNLEAYKPNTHSRDNHFIKIGFLDACEIKDKEIGRIGKDYIASEIAADAEIERLNRIIKNEERMRSYYVNELVECRNLLRRFLPKDESDWDRIIQLTQTEKDAMEYFRGKDVKRTR